MKFISVLAVFITVFNSLLNAQLCTGSLGDPVVNFTFGFGPGSGPRLEQGVTTFNYSGGSCPKAGEYSLLNLTFSCFDNSWHTLSGDHTPDDGGGYYMLVNSTGGNGTLFLKNVMGLCPNTTYEFATWLKNALRPTACDRNGVDPNITLTVETPAGTVLATFNSGDIPEEEEPAWKQYGMLFSTGASNTNVVLRIVSAVSTGCGNAFAIDDITLRPCGAKVEAKVASNGLPVIEVCEGTEASFALTSDYGPGFTNPLFQWQLKDNVGAWQNIPGANSKNYVARPAAAYGTYEFRMLMADAAGFSLSQCRISSNLVTVTIRHAPFVQATNYVYGCLNGDVTLMASGANNYVWTGPNGFTSTDQIFLLPKVQYSDAGLYKVTGTTYLGCSNSDSTILRIVPNATASSSQGATICEGTSAQLVAGGGFRYEWHPITGLSSDTAATPFASPTESTLYQVKVTNEWGCTDTAHIKVNVWKKPVADAGPDLKTRVGIPIVLKGSAKGSDVSWFWTPANSLSATQLLNPVTNPPQTTAYRLHVVSPHGCGTSTDDMMVKVFDKVLIPNAFSPNGDGVNDTWFIEPLDLFDESVTEVYNRYGQVVYRTVGYNTPWNGTRNGKPLPMGTYYYVIDLRINKEPRLTGSITILR